MRLAPNHVRAGDANLPPQKALLAVCADLALDCFDLQPWLKA